MAMNAYLEYVRMMATPVPTQEELERLEDKEWAMCCEAMEAAECGLTVSELRAERDYQQRTANQARAYRDLRLMARIDMANPQ